MKRVFSSLLLLLLFECNQIAPLKPGFSSCCLKRARRKMQMEEEEKRRRGGRR